MCQEYWYYANMFSRSIIILDDHLRRPTAQRRRRRGWIPPVPLLYHLPLMLLMIIASVFWFDVCRAWPSPGLLNIPPKIVRTGSVGVANGDNIEDNRAAATSIGVRADIGAIDDNVNINLGDLLQDIRNSAHIVNLTRHHDGDVFRTNKITKCNADTCVGLSSGTAGVLTIGNDKTDSHIRSLEQTRSKDPAVGSCDCRCLAYLSTYREDLGICVDDIHECTLSPFVSGSSSEKIPFVFLPLRGQIIYPSREISFPNIRTPVCAVTGAQYLTTNGWSDLRNPIDADYPFRMFRDEGRTFIQWLGESDLRRKMQGRLIVVHLVCRDMMFVLNSTKDAVMPPKNVFSSCVAFRVNGSPVKYLHNVSEVLFQPEATSILSSTTTGMSAKEYIVIGVCSLLLGLIYVSSVFLYLYMKKRKTHGQCHTRNSLSDLRNEINYPKNDQVTFGVPFNRTGSIYSVTSISTSVNDFQRTRSFVASPVGHNHLKEEIGIVKNNPLLQHFPNFADHHSGFTSDISNSNSECEMESTGFYDKRKQVDFLQTSALVHPTNERSGSASSSNGSSKPCDQQAESPASPTQENECLPEENVSIVEDIMNVEKFDSMRALVNGTVRKKLYFNPAYFEPELLVEPPPAAIEFLTKIREVIAIAKYKMSAKRYQPSLVDIPEESSLNNKNVTPNSVQQVSDECKGCVSNDCSHTRNCGDKRNSIEKWLQTVPHNENEQGDKKELPAEIENGKKQKATGSVCCRKKCSPTVYKTKKEMSPPKQRAPQPPIIQPNSSPATPKKSFHALKTNECQIVDGLKEQNRDTSTSSAPLATIVSPKTTISIRQKNDGMGRGEASASTTTGNPIYSFPGTCIELHSNSKFSLFHESPGSSQRSHASSHRSKSSRKRLEVLDQYNTAVTPTSLASSDRKRYEALRDMRQTPNRVYEAIAKDCNTLVTNNHLSNGFTLDIPTPDYDSTLEKKIKDIYNTQSTVSAPSVPTPDYSTLSKKSLRQCQPDSPIYRRKSPQYLIVDYETDSLERLATSKRKSSQSSSSPSSDVSSQLSPSLSTALPLEEEVEVRHTIYDKIDGFRKDGDSNIKKKLSSSSIVIGGKKSENDQAIVQKEVAARIKYDTPFRGSMTIEVEHEPQSDLELSTDSDQFEPDTLDRKPKKHSFCDVNAWTEHMNKSQCFVNSTKEDGQEQENYACLNKISELSNVATRTHSNQNQQHIFRSGSSFRNSEGNQRKDLSKESPKASYVDGRPTFGSLREIYQSRVMLQNAQRPKLTNCSFTEKGRLLTLEAKHTRRQQITPPQVEPPAESHESTKTDANSSPAMLRNEIRPIHVLKLKPKNIVNDSKNPQGWNTINQSVLDEGDGLKNNRCGLNFPKKKCVVHDCSTPQTTTAPTAAEEETTSNHSESTEITGVSDTQANSEFEDSCSKMTSTAGSKDDAHHPADKCDRNLKEIQKLNYEQSESKDESMDFSSRLNHLRNDYSLNKYLNRKKSIETDGESDSVQDAINNNTEINSKSRQFYEDLSRSPDAVAIGLRSNRNSGCLSDRTKEMYRNAGVPVGIAYPQRSVKNNSSAATNVQMVYRCEVVPVSNGMQIAMGLKDRAKKSKDLRNAWRKFVGMAASRFSPPSSYNKKASAFLESLEKDEGISSLIDELPRVSSVRSTFSAPASHSSANLYEHRYGCVRQQEMDSGYMSADSSEVHNRRFYDRYNFKLMTGKDHIIRVDTIKDNSDCDGSSNESTVELRHSCLSFKDTIRASLECKRIADRIRMESSNRSDEDDGDSDKTLTATSDDDNSQLAASAGLYSSEDEQCKSHSYGSSETDEGEEEINTDDMWESGAESIETHSVLYKNIRKSS